MTARIERARSLGEQLTIVMDRLASATEGSAAQLFLELLARVEGYPPAELAAVDGLPELVRDAIGARTEHATELGRAAGDSIDLERLLHTGRRLPETDDAGERDGWLRDVLFVATITPWLARSRQMLVRGALAKARAIVEADAEAFLAASILAEDRRALEQPTALAFDAREILGMLEELPLLVVFDRAAPRAGTGALERALAAARRALTEDADDALYDHELRRRPKLAPRSERLSLAASDETQFPLCRVEAGVWVLLRHAGVSRLRWVPDVRGTYGSAEVVGGGSLGLIIPDARGDLVLPVSEERLSVRLRVGPDSRVVVLEPAED